MKNSRHHHPHIDPRQPRDGSRPATNPPVFAWKPREGDERFELIVARDAELSDVALREADLRDPVFLPETALEAGHYWWRWSAGGDLSEVFAFEVAEDAVVLEVPPAGEWFDRMPDTHLRQSLQ